MKAKVILKPASPTVLPRWAHPMESALIDGVDCHPLHHMVDLTPRQGSGLVELAVRLRPQNAWGMARRVEDAKAFLATAKASGMKAVGAKNWAKESLPFAAGSVDLVTGLYTLEGVHGALDALGAVFRALKPGGQAVFAVITDEVFIEFRRAMLTDAKDLVAASDLWWQERYPSDVLWKPALVHHGFEPQGVHPGRMDLYFNRVDALLSHPDLGPTLEAWFATLPPARLKALLKMVTLRLDDLKKVHGGIRIRIPYAVVRALKPVPLESKK